MPQPRDVVETHESALTRWDQTRSEIVQRIFRPRTRLRVSDWAEQKRILSKEGGSAEHGPWRNIRTPYLVEIMDSLGDPEVTELVVMKSARVGFTEGVIGNGIGYFMDQEPSPILVIQPREHDAKDWSKTQLAPMLRDCPALAGKVSDSSRDPDNSILDKVFPGGYLKVRGAQSPLQLRRVTARVVFFDEVSAIRPNKEGDAVKQGETRADTYADRKIVKGSTPHIKGICRITSDFARTDQRYWFVPCPHCKQEQVLEWGGPDTPYGLKWEKEAHCHACSELLTEDGPCPKCEIKERDIRHLPDTAYYLCKHCGSAIDEGEKEWMVTHGRFVATNPNAPVRGWHINSLISLISDKARWPNLVQEWLDAQEDPALLQVFFNTVLGLPWEDRGEKFEPSDLEKRREIWADEAGERCEVPAGAGVLILSADVQGDRIEAIVKAYGKGEESWLITHQRFFGNPQAPGSDVWSRLEALRSRSFTHANGAELKIRASAIDAGYATDAVQAYVQSRPATVAVVGRSGYGKPPVARRKKSFFVTIGTDVLKDRIFARLKKTANSDRNMGEGMLHFCQPTDTGADAEYFAQFAAEKRMLVKSRRTGRMHYEYVQLRPRNEAIDLEVYNLAALSLVFPDRRDKALEAAVTAVNAMAKPKNIEAPKPAPAPRAASAQHRRGFIWRGM